MTTGNYPTGYTTTTCSAASIIRRRRARICRCATASTTSAAQNARNVGGLNDVSRGAALDDTDQTVAASFLSTLSSGMINEARAQYTRSRLAAPVNDVIGPAVNISGVASWGTATFSPTARDLDVVQAVDTLTLQRGDHLVKAGGDLLYNRVDDRRFLARCRASTRSRRWRTFSAGIYSTFQQAFGEPSQFQSNPNLGLFVQDEWRVRRDLTVERRPPLRPAVAAGADPARRQQRVAASRRRVRARRREDRRPRERRLYFDRIPLRATSNALQRDGTKYQVAVLSFGQPGAPVWPAVLPAFPAGVLASVTTINPDIQDGRSEQAAVEVERAIGHGMSASVGLLLSARPRHHHVAQRQRADADRGAGQRRSASRTSAGRTRTSATSASTIRSATRGPTG